MFSPYGENSFGLEETMEISTIPRFLGGFGGFKWGLYFSWFFFEKNRSNLVSNTEPRRFQRTKEVSNNFSVS